MATPSEKLAASLLVLKTIQEQGIVVIKSSEINPKHLESI